MNERREPREPPESPTLPATQHQLLCHDGGQQPSYDVTQNLAIVDGAR